MIENTVEHDFYAVFVKLFTYLLKIIVTSESYIYLPVVSGVISMGIGFKDRREINGIASELFYMRYPVKYL